MPAKWQSRPWTAPTDKNAIATQIQKGLGFTEAFLLQTFYPAT